MSNALVLDTERFGDLSLYYREVSKFPVLSPEEERELALRWHDEHDVEAAHRLVTGNLRFVIKVAYEYKRYGLRMLDLIQEGNVGLMRAVHKFDPYKGYRLISYAVWWIRAHIHDFILRSWSLVRVGTTRKERKLFNRLQSAQKRIRALVGRDDGVSHDELLAAELDIPVDEVVDFRRRIQAPDVSLDEPVFDDGSERALDRLESHAADQEDVVSQSQTQTRLQKRLTAALDTLDERDRLVVRERFLTEEPTTLQELGDRLGISKERVRQLEARAMKRLREELADCQVSLDL